MCVCVCVRGFLSDFPLCHAADPAHLHQFISICSRLRRVSDETTYDCPLLYYFSSDRQTPNLAESMVSNPTHSSFTADPLGGAIGILFELKESGMF